MTFFFLLEDVTGMVDIFNNDNIKDKVESHTVGAASNPEF